MKSANASLLLVDPLQSFLGVKTDMNQANQTRPLLDNISGIAERARLAVIIVRHLAKAGSTHAIGRALGSIDITAEIPHRVPDRRCPGRVGYSGHRAPKARRTPASRLVALCNRGNKGLRPLGLERFDDDLYTRSLDARKESHPLNRATRRRNT